MLIHENRPGNNNIFNFGKVSLIIVPIILALLFIYFISLPKENSEKYIFCDAEKVVSKDSLKLFRNGGNLFLNGQSQSNEKSRSGKYSSKLDKEVKYGIHFNLMNPKPGEQYEARVWRYQSGSRSGSIVASDATGETLYKTEISPTETDSKGWDLLVLRFFVPYFGETDFIRVYVHSNGEGVVYFDDFEIRKIESGETRTAQTGWPDQISLKLSPEAYQKLANKRDEALNKGILITEESDWVKGKILLGKDESLDVSLRLKGDFLDHLSGNKWSFRIRVKDPGSWMGLKTFSVQHPMTREFLKEWVHLSALNREDLLGPRYGFTHLELNGEPLGIFAIEEHFDKQLVESMNRREGPILRFSEDAYFEGILRDLEAYGKDPNKGNWHSSEASEILPFRETRTLESPVLLEQFILARDLLESYRTGKLGPESVFDLDQMAKFFAITDVSGGYHALVWHNLRFYFNPITSKLEPVAFDAFGIGIDKWKGRPFFGYGIFGAESGENLLYTRLFDNQEFFSKYIYYLKKFSHIEYINQLLGDLEPNLQANEKLLKEEFPNYSFDRDGFRQNGLEIHTLLEPLESNAITVRKINEKEGKWIISVQNKYFLPLIVKSYTVQKNDAQIQLENPIWLPAYQPGTIPQFQVFEALPGLSKIFYQVPGIDSLLESPILPFSSPSIRTGNPFFIAELKNDHPAYKIEKNNILFKAGIHKITEDLRFPSGYQIIIPHGTIMDFTKGAGFISQSPVSLNGTESSPIQLTSSEGSASGFSVINAEKESVLNYVLFDGLNTLHREGWMLTGAVNFYKSPLVMENCSITDNHCEDAMNIIRSHFSITNVRFQNSHLDGLDIDFSEGKITNCSFANSGNDALDISGSVVVVANLNIENPGDKGISVGEMSTVEILDAIVKGAPMALVSKDLSEVLVRNIQIENCGTGFAVYQKKPEFGGGKMRVEKVKASGVERLYRVESGSFLSLEGREIGADKIR